jgi:peptidoglycan hydrolase CwlO-like protein
MFITQIKSKNLYTEISKFNILSKLNKIFASFALILIMFSAGPTQALTKDEALAEKNRLNSENSTYQQQISELRNQNKTIANEVAIVDLQIAQVEKEIQAAENEIVITNAEIEETNLAIVKAEADLAKNNESIKEYLRVMYMDGQTSTIEVIATSNTLTDFINKSEYINSVHEKVQDTIKKIEEIKIELDTKKNDLELKKAKAEQLKSEQVTKRYQIEYQRSQKNALIANNNGSIGGLNSAVNRNNSRAGLLDCIIYGGCEGDSVGEITVVNSSPYFSQLDPAYSGYVYHGTSDIGNYGCLITSLAMVRSRLGSYTNPIQEASLHSYVGDGLMSGWDFAGRPKVDISGNWSLINQKLDNGIPVIVGVTMNGSGYWSHFIVLTGREGATYYANDPAFSAGKRYAKSRVFAAYSTY